jgi:malate dehydrogenase (oxaloacetate-decarboxylating)(NADP+)
MGSTPTDLPGEDVADNRSGVGGGISDVYGEDSATLDQLVTPWVTSVASGYTLMRDPRYNKGLAFTDKERDAHYLTGLLPPVILSQDVQERKVMHNLRQYTVPLQRYMALMDLQERNESGSLSGSNLGLDFDLTITKTNSND